MGDSLKNECIVSTMPPKGPMDKRRGTRKNYGKYSQGVGWRCWLIFERGRVNVTGKRSKNNLNQ